MQNKHILVNIHHNTGSGGIATYLRGLWSNLNIEYKIITSEKEKKSDKIPNIKTEYVKLTNGKNTISRWIRTFLWIFVLLSKTKKDTILHCGQIFATGFAGTIVNIIKGNSFVVYTYGSEINICKKKYFRKLVLKLILSKATLVVTISEYSKKLLEDFNCESKKIFVLTPGTNPNRSILEKDIKKWEHIKTKPNKSNKKTKIILSVSRLVKRKGHITVIKALPQILKKFPDTHYIISGNGPYEKKLKEIAKKIKVDRNITFTGHLPESEINALYSICDIFVLVPFEEKKSADIEGFGIVYLEANSFGKPVVGSNSGGIPDAIENNKTGLLVSPQNTKETTEAIIKLLSEKETRIKMGNNGKKRVMEKFNWKYKAGDFEKKLAEIF